MSELRGAGEPDLQRRGVLRTAAEGRARRARVARRGIAERWRLGCRAVQRFWLDYGLRFTLSHAVAQSGCRQRRARSGHYHPA